MKDIMKIAITMGSKGFKSVTLGAGLVVVMVAVTGGTKGLSEMSLEDLLK